MFNQTMQTVGEIVKDDVKLGTLYTTLILATPGEELSHMAKVLLENIIFIHLEYSFLDKPSSCHSSARNNFAHLQISQEQIQGCRQGY